jgi:5-methylcytosine-specific restriction endonuclease McrA
MPKKKSKIKILKKECEKLMNEVAELLWEKECLICKSREKVLVHHFIPRHLAKHLIYNPHNWVFLCKKCHFELHKKENPTIVIEIYKKKGEDWYKRLLSLYKKKPGGISPKKFLEIEKAKLLSLLRRILTLDM